MSMIILSSELSATGSTSARCNGAVPAHRPTSLNQPIFASVSFLLLLGYTGQQHAVLGVVGIGIRVSVISLSVCNPMCLCLCKKTEKTIVKNLM